MVKTANNTISKQELKEKELIRIFEGVDEEIDLITASAKFDYNLRKTNENDLKIKLAYIEDTAKIVTLLKNRISLRWQTTS
ncbi:MAG: hypothetical protein NWF00_02840 [Candidatus Bathyarchaeota archaeon]|nr:hypothetical protein [Candidatus Bathyarchaeota archaeon]